MRGWLLQKTRLRSVSWREFDSDYMDNVLLAVFGTLSIFGIGFGAFSTWMAMRAARDPKSSELALAGWSVGALLGLTAGGMSLAYFVIPILLHHWRS
jgi:hypothetical protein